MTTYILSELKKMGYNNVYEENIDGVKKLSNISGKIYVCSAKLIFGKLTITIDTTKSSNDVMNKINELDKFLNDYASNKNILLSGMFIRKIDDIFSEIVCRCSSENINLRKPYKIPLVDISGFKNFDMYVTLSVGLYMFEHVMPLSGVTKCKIISMTIPYDNCIYTKYMIGEDLKKMDAIPVVNKPKNTDRYQFKKKADLTNEILDIIRKNKK